MQNGLQAKERVLNTLRLITGTELAGAKSFCGDNQDFRNFREICGIEPAPGSSKCLEAADQQRRFV